MPVWEILAEAPFRGGCLRACAVQSLFVRYFYFKGEACMRCGILFLKKGDFY